MRTIIEENSNTEHTTVIIKCRETTDGIRKLAEYIEKYTQRVVVYKNNERFSILKTTVYYLETVDGKLFVTRKIVFLKLDSHLIMLKKCSLKTVLSEYAEIVQ